MPVDFTIQGESVATQNMFFCVRVRVCLVYKLKIRNTINPSIIYGWVVGFCSATVLIPPGYLHPEKGTH
jgi:hypothetical protein